MKKRYAFILLFLAIQLQAQVAVTDSITIKHGISTKKQFTLLTGGALGANGYLEAGVGKNYSIDILDGLPLTNGYYFATEVRPGDNFIVAPKVGVWASCLLAVGANAVYYTNFNEGSLCLRPEAGFGWSNFKVMYGYNIPITNKDMKGVNGSNFSLALFWRLGGEKF